MEWTLVGKKLILKTDTIHTCRNFDRILDWANKRRTNYEEKESIKNGTIYVVD
jgi:hypothetical protein